MGETMTRDELLAIAKAAGQGSRKHVDRIKAIANAAGYKGRLGGWIESPAGTPVVQGWQAFARELDTSAVERLLAAADKVAAPRGAKATVRNVPWRRLEAGSYEHVPTGTTVYKLDSKRWRAYLPNHSWQDAVPQHFATRYSKAEAVAVAERWIASTLPDMVERAETEAYREADARHPSRERWDELVAVAQYGPNSPAAGPHSAREHALDTLHGEARLENIDRDVATPVLPGELDHRPLISESTLRSISETVRAAGSAPPPRAGGRVTLIHAMQTERAVATALRMVRSALGDTVADGANIVDDVARELGVTL